MSSTTNHKAPLLSHDDGISNDNNNSNNNSNSSSNNNNNNTPSSTGSSSSSRSKPKFSIRSPIKHNRITSLYEQVNKLGVIFLLLVLIQAMAVIGGTIANIVLNHMSTQPSYTSYFLSSILIVIMVSMTYFAFDSVLFENSFELLGFTVASLVMFIRLLYGLVEMLKEHQSSSGGGSGGSSIKSPRQLSALITSCIVLFIQLLQFVLLVPLQRSFGWRSFRLVGTDDKLIRRYRIYNFFLACIKIDTLLSVLVLVMGLFFVQFDFWLSYVGVGLGMAVSLLCVPLLIIGIRFERLLIVVLWCIWSPALPGYLIYKVVTFWLYKGHIHQWNGSTLNDKDLMIILTLLCICTMLMRVLLWIVTVIASLNFGYGLKDIHKRAKQEAEKVNTSEYWRIGPNGEIIFNGDHGGDEPTTPYYK